MILVTGATGHFGKAAIDFLLQKGVRPSDINALVRDENRARDLNNKGIGLRTGHYSDEASLVKAFSGIHRLLFVSGSDIRDRSAQHLNVVNAAQKAGVKHVVYTSFDRKNETASSPIAFVAQSHLDTEKALRESGLTYTILRNGIYADMLPVFLGEKVLETGAYLPAGNTPVAFTLRSDMAEAAAAVITGKGHENKEYVLTSPEGLTLPDVAQIIGRAAGVQLAYIDPPTGVYVKTLTEAGVPAEYVGMFAGFAEAFKQGEFLPGRSDLETLLGRKPASVRDFLHAVYENK